MANYLPHLVHRCISHHVLKRGALKQIYLLKFNRQYGSALFISGRRGMEVFSFLSPYLDFDNRLKDMDKLQRDLIARGINMDVMEIKKMWELYKSASEDRYRLEEKSTHLEDQIKSLTRKRIVSEEHQLELTKLKLQRRVLQEDLKCAKETVWDLSENVVEKLLKLPNEVDETIPVQSTDVLKRSSTLKQFSGSEDKKNHIEIGRNLGLLEYKNPMQYYLCNDAALFELGALSYAAKVLSTNNMIRVTGSDFSRSLLVEGSGLNHENPFDAFIIDNHTDVSKTSENKMHLVGGASLVAFLAMHAKQLLNPNNLPIAYFSTGRQYTPFPPGGTPIGLFTVCQASAVHAFVLVKDVDVNEYHKQFEKLLTSVKTLYNNLCDDYQIIKRPVSELRPWESMRMSFELWSPFSKQYIEVGHISACGNYLSKRLLIAYQQPTGRDYPWVISGTVLSVPRLLGCLLEQNPDKFVIPSKIQESL